MGARARPTAQRSGSGLAQLRKRWEAPGLAVIAPDDSKITVVLFFKAAARARWRRPASGARDFRAQQYAPPDPLPADTIEIYTAGAADARKKGFPDPPGGFGFAAYTQRTTRMYEVGEAFMTDKARAANKLGAPAKLRKAQEFHGPDREPVEEFTGATAIFTTASGDHGVRFDRLGYTGALGWNVYVAIGKVEPARIESTRRT